MKVLYRSIITLLLALLSTDAFAPPPKSLRTNVKPFILPRDKKRGTFTARRAFDRSPALFYRALEEDDDGTTMTRLQTRAPPGYDMKRVLAEQQRKKTGMNLPLIRALIVNQFLILGLASAVLLVRLFFVSGFDALTNLDEILRWTGEGPNLLNLAITADRLLWGIGGALPLLTFSYLLENSDSRALSRINFSTIAMVMTLFGRRTAPPDEMIPPQLKGKMFPTTKTKDVLLESFTLATVTGFCEESVFRRELPALISQYTGGNVALSLLGSSLLFGLGHASKGMRLEENAVMISTMAITGLGFGLIYILSGGDIVPCMIAHAFYDFVTFVKTWLDANAQIEYADRMYQQPLPQETENEVQRILRSSKASIDPRRYAAVKRLFFVFDFDKNRSLSKSEVRKGISYLAIEKEATPPPQSEIDRLITYIIQTRDKSAAETAKNRLSFPDFVRLISMMGRDEKKSALVGT